MTLFSLLRPRRHRPLTDSAQAKRKQAMGGSNEARRELERLFGRSMAQPQEGGQPLISLRGNHNIVITAPVTIGALSTEQLSALLASFTPQKS